MNMDMLSRVFDMIQRVGGMEQVGQLMVIVYGVICVWPYELYSWIPYLAVLDDDFRISHRRRRRFCGNLYIRCPG